MSTMNVSLPDELKAFVDERVDDGGFGSTSEYVRDLIRRDQDREHTKEQGPARDLALRVVVDAQLPAVVTITVHELVPVPSVSRTSNSRLRSPVAALPPLPATTLMRARSKKIQSSSPRRSVAVAPACLGQALQLHAS